MSKGYTKIRTIKTVTVNGEMILPGNEIEVTNKIGNDLIDRDAAEKVKNSSTEEKENSK